MHAAPAPNPHAPAAHADGAPLSILHTEASCGWGGQELRILSESAALMARGHRVHLLADPRSRIAEQAPRFGLGVTTMPIEHKTWAGFAALRAHLKAQRYDVINTHSSTDSWLAALAAATLRDAPPLVRTRHISAPFKVNPLTRWVYTRAAAGVVTTGERLRQDVIDTLGAEPSRVVSIPTGIDTQRFCPAGTAGRAALRQRLGLPGQVWLIGIVATLRSWKGHADLIDTLAATALEAPAPWHLLIVGDGPQRDNIQAQVARLGLTGRVTLAGHQDAPADWFRSLDLFCLPSYANEGVPQSLMQAMACGLPCVTTTAGAITEAVTHERDALVITPRDLSALGASLARLARDATLAARLGQAARERAVARFGIDAMAEAMLRVFRAARAGRPIAAAP